MTRRKLAAVLAAVVLIVPGCAGVPSSSSPQAIGTVQRPAPPGMPAPTPGMEPETVLREFLKATAARPTGIGRPANSLPNPVRGLGMTRALPC
ncbi:Probable conserved lipoprotein LpqB [Mycobacteroides abscessus]|nr:Probable conserved lipoprotein LpqB [Mycobacteroides abscessus]